ncbi:hypothetical protein H6P81_009124 [Aristolochia fimbriata]|uniref:Ultraviolet-B receptor UVR8 n=1 Tax=Aristolochia fimbriata TaxID=158543 RepID=A0AAV7EKB4_ARIFI|nr:hypothetical protein H6P81_009124 [Aristolochia fimbriata]
MTTDSCLKPTPEVAIQMTEAAKVAAADANTMSGPLVAVSGGMDRWRTSICGMPGSTLHILLRVVCFLSSVAALSFMVTAEQSATLSIYGFNLPVYAKWTYADSFEYLVGISAAVAAYSLLQMLLTLRKLLEKSPVIPSRYHCWLIFSGDQAFAYTMMSAASAASGVTNLNRTGIRHSSLPNFSGWKPTICTIQAMAHIKQLESLPERLTIWFLQGTARCFRGVEGALVGLGRGKNPTSCFRRRSSLILDRKGRFWERIMKDMGLGLLGLLRELIIVWRWKTMAQFGHGAIIYLGVLEENSSYPCFVKQFLELGSPKTLTNESNSGTKGPLKVCSVKAGGMMSFAIDNQGSLWMWGSCPPQKNSEDGTFSLVSSSIPQPVWDFHGHAVVKVACGTEHVMALVSAGETYSGGGDLLCYAWGNNHHGQLGVGDTKVRFHPEILEAFGPESPWLVYEIACGAHHTAVLTQNKDALESEREEFRCWTFGLGENGQLGHGTTNSLCSPKPVVELPSDVLLVSVDCGLFHTCVVADAGGVWSWGMERGLGLCPDARYSGADSGDALLPLRISSDEFHVSNFPGPVQVACGAAHTVLVTENGYKVWAWGRGWSGVLGRGTLVDSFTPCVAMWPPLVKDFDDERGRKVSGDHTGEGKVESERVVEMERKLSLAMEEMQLVQSKLTLIERYASVLHTSIFGKPFDERELPSTLRNWGMFNVEREWENMIESADVGKLTRMAAFYRHMLAEVKDKLMKKRLEEMVKDSLRSLSSQNQGFGGHGASSK